MTTYITLAIVDDVNTCDCCGKTNLKSTVQMERDDGEVLYFGSVCATRHSGRQAKDIRSEARAAYDARVAAARTEYNASEEELAARAKFAEATAAAIRPGRDFRDFCAAAIEVAAARRRAVATKFGLDFYAF